MNDKILKTFEIFDDYEKRFAAARLEKKLRSPWEQSDRDEILKNVKEILALDKIPIPEIKVISEKSEACSGINVKHITYRSWDNFYGTFSLYSPPGGGKRPLIFVCPGHAKEGRMGEGYQKMSLSLAKLGAYIICNDNIGQGSRESFGHWKSIAPLFYGITLQGMIVRETIALIEYAKGLPFADTEKIGACGNSGGGTLTAFLAALEPSLAAVASCGYPSEFPYIFQKEREHCACNLLIGVASSVEMWELYSLRAPKPLMIEQGEYDQLIPNEYFLRNARKISTVYSMMNSAENFKHRMTDTLHAWKNEDIEVISQYFKEQFSLEGELTEITEIMTPCKSEYPDDAISTNALAGRLTNTEIPESLKLEDIFVPKYRGKKIEPYSIETDLGRGDVMRVFAQFELALNQE